MNSLDFGEDLAPIPVPVDPATERTTVARRLGHNLFALQQAVGLLTRTPDELQVAGRGERFIKGMSVMTVGVLGGAALHKYGLF